MLGSGKLGYGISRHGGLGALRRVLVGSVRVGHGVAVGVRCVSVLLVLVSFVKAV